MATDTYATLTTALSARIRDPNNTAHAAADVTDVLQRCANLVNAATDASRVQTIIGSGTPALPFIALGGSYLRLSEVRIGKSNAAALAATPLIRCHWQTLAALDPRWLTRQALQPQFWDLIGQDLLLLWPKWTTPLTLVLRHLQDTSSATTTIPYAQEHVPQILALAEQVLLLRQRLFASVAPAATRSQHVAQGLAVP